MSPDIRLRRTTKTLTFANVSLFDQLEAQLRAGKLVEDGREEVLYVQTVQFSDGCQMDIKVVNSEDGPWTQGVLFHAPGKPGVLLRPQGPFSPIGRTEIKEKLAGEYIVAVDDKEYCVVVKRATDEHAAIESRVQKGSFHSIAPPCPKAPPICPRCGNDMELIGSVGITQNDGDWDAEVERFDCPEGHTILLLETERIVCEAYCENCGAPCEYNSEICLCSKCEEKANGTEPRDTP